MARQVNAPATPLTSIQLIELAKRNLAMKEPPERRFLPISDYRFAKLMGFRQTRVSNWRTGYSTIGREFVKRFAEVTGLPEPYILLCLELEREKNPEVRGFFQELIRAFSRIKPSRVATVVLALGLGVGFAAPRPSQAATGPQAGAFDRSIHYANWRRRRRSWRPRRRLGVIPVAA